MGTTLVRFAFDPERFIAHEQSALSEAALPRFLRLVRDGAAALPHWPLRAMGDGDDTLDALARATTDRALSVLAEGSLAQCVLRDERDAVTALYLFDHDYVRAHPECVESEHLALLHGTVAAKLYDERCLLLDEEGLCASLRWRTAKARSKRLTREGSRS